ncbi:hypothetical protein E1265_01400 [Streptomyces sp. 8K308]|uniref:hypothetical protein n=1 Tax=Streptomyces sp. 8K308 TaxID=2530388 RepID=UPI0010484C7D|nr:hypothetical protein [Streptomyces sp. 8K308]TDC27575.1 hypothetical protein E1265_01400 [Streptomyces sp. 8K308]
MPMSDEELEQMFRSADPVAHRTLPDPPPFRPRARFRRRFVIPVVAALAIGGATAAGTTWIVGDGEGHSFDSTTVSCMAAHGRGDAVVGFNPVTDDPLEQCAEAWEGMLDEPVPAELTACVGWNGSGDSVHVWPGSGPEVCVDHESDPWAGPTPEQLDFGQFRLDLESRLPSGECLPRAEIEGLLSRLLAENQLEGWTVHIVDSPNEAVSEDCMELAHYLEDDREVWIQAL